MIIVALAFLAGSRWVISDQGTGDQLHFALPFDTSIPVFSCPFYSLTSIPCPVCGITRSSALIARGDIIGGFRAHPLGPLLALLMVLAIPYSVWVLITDRGESASKPVGAPGTARGKWILWLAAALILASWGLSLARHFGLTGW